VSDPRRTKPSRTSSMPAIARIGARLAARRIELRLTQQMLADLAGVSRSSIQALEYGNGSIKFASVVDIADALGLRLEPIPAATHTETEQ
jgi:transcriptional regulator with XRE-family HTH domain